MMQVSGKTKSIKTTWPTLAAIRRSGLPAVALAAVVLSGCSTLSPPSTSTAATGSSVAAGAATRQYHQAIDVSGRLSIRYQQNGKDQAVHGSFTWSQDKRETVITLLSPLGQTLATINIAADQATLKQSGQPARSASDVDALTVQALGWPLPIAGLRDWLQGFGQSAAGKRFTATPPTAADSFSVTTADNWLIQYTNWQDLGSGAESYPKRIDLARNATQAGDVAIRIVIDSRQPH
ncbi:outer membrane lipoprotein LolB [Collimonas sp. OK607]|uniref:lipoprotein insertase outer membrane protein LolB n=1 Tax=Collimonas sp. OK607 TaxID=1798194 RepID=UPI0008E207DA|nr:lipoprotein insertase outer membrane protein LolB [Collimonas sp. OK607]SFB27053.1 outer membrane lipoprotein LolB [Collimonas sp. OK607]